MILQMTHLTRFHFDELSREIFESKEVSGGTANLVIAAPQKVQLQFNNDILDNFLKQSNHQQNVCKLTASVIYQAHVSCFIK